jgi:RNA polymerase sigma-70 factor (family 1)
LSKNKSTTLIAELLEFYSDEDLLLLLKDGELSAFNTLFNRYQKKAYRMALYRLREKEAAEEVVQELFVNLWIRRDKIVITQTFASYLFTALKYTILNYIRHEAVRDKYVAFIEKDLSELDDSTQEQISADDFESNLDNAIKDLPDQCGKVFTMRHKEQYSVKEIAENLSISPNTVKNHLSKAQKLLRLQLKEFLPLLIFILEIL